MACRDKAVAGHEPQPSVAFQCTIQSFANKPSFCRLVTLAADVEGVKIEVVDTPTLKDRPHVRVCAEAQNADTGSDCQDISPSIPDDLAHFACTTDIAYDATTLGRNLDERKGVQSHDRPTSASTHPRGWTPRAAFLYELPKSRLVDRFNDPYEVA